jgi:hypothetical protein
MRHTTLAPIALALATTGLLVACGPNPTEQVAKATESAHRLQEGVVDHATNRGGWPKHIDELKVAGDPLPGVSYAVGEGGVVAVYFAEGSGLAGARLVYTPSQDAQGNVSWQCASAGLEGELKPADCS